MAIRITGMNSGLDTDAMVQDLVKAYDKKKETMKGDQKRLTWKQDAWKELNGKIKNFVTKSLSNMRFSSSYSKKKTEISDSSIASVVSSDGAVNGKQTLRVTDLAQAAYLTGSDEAERAGVQQRQRCDQPEEGQRRADPDRCQQGHDRRPVSEHAQGIGPERKL